jgi:ureidoacrylate peracid hydrolase
MSDIDDRYAAAGALSHRPLLRGLAQKLSPKHSALVVIDMQNDFLAEGGVMAREGADVAYAQGATGKVLELIEGARRAGVLVVFVRNVYSTATNRYLSDVWLEQAARRRPGGYTLIPMCEEGAWGGEFYGDIQPKAGEPVIIKHRYSGFLNTELDTILRAHDIRSLVFAGVSTNCCVESTAREAFMRDFYVVVSDDATGGYSKAQHDTALATLEMLFGEVASTGVICDLWAAAS